MCSSRGVVVAAGRLAGCGLQAGISKQLSLTVASTPTRKMCLLGPSCHVTSDQDKELMALSPCSMNALFFMMSETVG